MEEEIKVKTCPACGTKFECSHNADCWCTKYSISEANTKYLALHYNDCLCKVCLLKYADFKIDTGL